MSFGPVERNQIAGIIDCYRKVYFRFFHKLFNQGRFIVPIYPDNGKLVFISLVSFDKVRQLLTAKVSINRPKIEQDGLAPKLAQFQTLAVYILRRKIRRGKAHRHFNGWLSLIASGCACYGCACPRRSWRNTTGTGIIAASRQD